MKIRTFKSVLAAALLPVVFSASPSALPEPVPSSALTCIEPVEGVTWMHWTASGQEKLERWCSTIGPPVLRTSPGASADITRLVVVTWNVHVGGGQVEDFVRTHWVDRENTGLVLLLEETYRADDAVPGFLTKGLGVPAAIRPKPRSADVVRLAERLNLSAAYVPSMRNGGAIEPGQREDRGNAILSSEPLSDVRAITLPFGKQRRVAVTATVTPRSSTLPSFRVVATHFDIGSSRVMQAEALGERVDGLRELPIVVGGDFNSPNGLHDKAVQAIAGRVPMESCGEGRTFTWPQKFNLLAFLDFGRFDFIFSDLQASGLTRRCRTIDDWFKSDHRPVMLTVS